MKQTISIQLNKIRFGLVTLKYFTRCAKFTLIICLSLQRYRINNKVVKFVANILTLWQKY